MRYFSAPMLLSLLVLASDTIRPSLSPADMLKPGARLPGPCCFSLVPTEAQGRIISGSPTVRSRLYLSPPVRASAPSADSGILKVRWLGSKGGVLDPAEEGLLFSRPRFRGAGAADDLSRFSIEVAGAIRPASVRMSLVSVDPASNRVRDRLSLRSFHLKDGDRVRTGWLVLVSDRDDRTAPQYRDQSLLAALGDRIEVRVREGGRRAIVRTIPVARPIGEKGASSIMPIGINVIILQDQASGQPIVGGDEAGARAVMQHQLRVAGEVLAQCAISIGLRDRTRFSVVPSPPPSLLSVGNRFGLRSRGGQIGIAIDDRKLGPWKIGADYTPLQTARLIGHQLESAGYRVSLTENPRHPAYAHTSADLLVRNGDGTLVHMAPWPDAPLSTEPMQSVEIGVVDLMDGIEAYDDMSAKGGTLEERALVKALTDDDQRTVDILAIGGFTGAERQGESFVQSSGAPIANTVLVDVNALARARQSYALTHELGHVLLDDLGHPEGRGGRDTANLMHSRSSSAVNGPKRISEAVCKKMRQHIEKDLQ